MRDYERLGYDLAGCLEYNPQNEFAAEDIAEVLAVAEGEHDGEDWHWLLQLSDGRYAKLVGGCDYSGWDCQSSASSWLANTAEEALALGESEYEFNRDDWQKQTQSLATQLKLGVRSQTRREIVRKGLGLED